jgi:hypothetical protein|tara:strand:- start:318 stop:923 length:606 start_codon:yes stop_codon:yes gene_type:complete
VARLKGVRQVSGRWPGKRALLFDRDGDRVELDLGTNHEEVTIAMWMKADRWDYNNTSLISSNGWGPGSLHLQVLNGAGWKACAKIVHGDRTIATRTYSRDSVELGRWHHVAYVISMRTGKSQIFLDGEPGPLVDFPENTPLNPGVMRLGDWEWWGSLESPHPKHKGFRGRIDEFIALRRALSQDEIGEMVTHGRPNFLWTE